MKKQFQSLDKLQGKNIRWQGENEKEYERYINGTVEGAYDAYDGRIKKAENSIEEKRAFLDRQMAQASSSLLTVNRQILIKAKD